MNNFPQGMILQVDSHPLTDVGKKRSNNEDWVAGFEPTELDEIKYSGCLYIVADGVGGASKGERASKYAAQKVLYDYYQQPNSPLDQRLQKIIREACSDIYQYSIENGLSRMATTLVAAVVRGDKLTIANVGDSRGYLIRSGQITQITRDHNLADELIRNGSMTTEEAKFSKTRNKLMRSLGGESDVDVDIFSDIQLYPGDLILLCSDGLTRYATEDDLIRLSADGSPEEIARKMVDFANQSGGADNISVYLVEICSPGEKRTKISLGQAPEPVDWDTIQTQYNIRKIRPKRHYPGRKFITSALIGLFVLIIIVGGIVLGKNIQEIDFIKSSALPSPLPEIFATSTNEIPLVTSTLQPLLPAGNQEVTTTDIPDTLSGVTVTPTASPSNEGVYACVHLIQEGEWAVNIFIKFEIKISDNDDVFETEDCNFNEGTCKHNFIPTKANNIHTGYYLKIPPAQSKEQCEIDETYQWVTILE